MRNESGHFAPSPCLGAWATRALQRAPAGSALPAASPYTDLLEGCAADLRFAAIRAAALQAGCERLLTKNLQHGRRLDTPRTENQFRAYKRNRASQASPARSATEPRKRRPPG